MDFMTVMGAIGGWFEIIFVTFGLLVNLISSKKYIASIIRKLYMIRKMPEISPKHSSRCIYICPCLFRKAWSNLKLESNLSFNMWHYVED